MATEYELLTIDEAARLLKVHRSHIFRLMRSGELPFVKRGKRYTRILSGDLVAFIQRHRKEAIATKEVRQ